MLTKTRRGLYLFLTEGRARSGRQFQTTAFSENEMFEMYYRTFSLADSWYFHKQILLHKDCPLSIRDRFFHSKIWYQRLTAMLCKHVRGIYLDRALFDKDKRIRRAALSTAMQENPSLYALAVQDNLLKDAAKILSKKKKMIADEPALGLLDPYRYVRELAQESLKGKKP